MTSLDRLYAIARVASEPERLAQLEAWAADCLVAITDSDRYERPAPHLSQEFVEYQVARRVASMRLRAADRLPWTVSRRDGRKGVALEVRLVCLKEQS